MFLYLVFIQEWSRMSNYSFAPSRQLANLGLCLVLSLWLFSNATYGQELQTVLFNGNIHHNQEREAKLEKKLRKQAEKAIRQAIHIPDEIPDAEHYTIVTRSKSAHAYPRQIFVSAYVESWNECLFVIGNTEAPLEGDIYTNTYHSFKNLAPAGAGHAAGFHECQSRVIALSQLYREELIRQVARDLYREIPGSIYNGTTRKFKLIPSEAKRVSTTKSPTKSWPSPGDSRGDLKVGSEDAAELP